MADSSIDQICFTRESDCVAFKPHYLRPNFCCTCMKQIEKHKREAVKSVEDVQRALEHMQKGEKEASLVLDPSNGLGPLFLGGFKSAINDDFLRKNKITHILNVAGKGLTRIFGPRYEVIAAAIHQELELNVLDLEWEDSMEFKLTHSALETAAKFIDDGRKTGAILVHCAQGKSRSSSAVCAYIMAKEGLDMLPAMEKIQLRRKMADPNVNFRLTLKKFENSESLEQLRKTLA